MIRVPYLTHVTVRGTVGVLQPSADGPVRMIRLTLRNDISYRRSKRFHFFTDTGINKERQNIVTTM